MAFGTMRLRTPSNVVGGKPALCNAVIKVGTAVAALVMRRIAADYRATGALTLSPLTYPATEALGGSPWRTDILIIAHFTADNEATMPTIGRVVPPEAVIQPISGISRDLHTR